jgi:hypothetical protein
MCKFFVRIFALSYTPERRNMQVDAPIRYGYVAAECRCVSGFRRLISSVYLTLHRRDDRWKLSPVQEQGWPLNIAVTGQRCAGSLLTKIIPRKIF